MVDAMEQLLTVGVLGPIRVMWQEAEVPLKPAGLRIIAYLASRYGSAAQTVEIVTALWPDITEDRGKNRIRVALSAVRETLASAGIPDPVRSLTGAYGLDTSVCRVDAEEFEDHVRTARTLSQTNTQEAAARYRAALGVFPPGAEPYADLLAHDFAVEENRRLSSLRSAIAADLIDLELGVAPTESLIRDIQLALASDPLNERLYSAWMISEYRAGRQSEALRIAERARALLAQETGLEVHPFIHRAEARILSQDPSLLGLPTQLPPHPLAQSPAYTTDFIGREVEMAELKSRMFDTDPVTVVGPGGTGKTRLVVECLASIDRDVAFVDLTRIRRDGDIRPVIAAALGVESGPEGLDREIFGALRDGTSCLVLDNCEHVLDHVASFVRHAVEIGGVKIVATSRETLSVDGEVVVRLRGLGTDAADQAEQSLSESGRLFVDRALRGGEVLDLSDPHVIEVIERICRRRDGLPLAIELAASWVPFLSLEDIQEGLLEHVDVMSGTRRSSSGRAESMEETLGWSYSLLREREQMVFRRAALLERGFTFDLLALVCSDLAPKTVRAAHTRLVAHQLIDRYSAATRSRFVMLQTIRSFGAERAEESDIDAVTNALARWAWQVAEDAGPRTDGEEGTELFHVLDDEIGNLLLSARLSLAGQDPSVAMQLVSRLHGYVIARALLMDEFLDLFRQAEPMIDETGPSRWARAIIGAGLVSFHAGDLEYASTLLRRAIDLAVAEQDHLNELNARHSLGRVLVQMAEIDEARNVLREATDLSRRLDDPMRLSRDLAEQAGVEAPESQSLCLGEATDLVSMDAHHVTATYVTAQYAWFTLGVGDVEASGASFTHALSEYRSHDSEVAVVEMLWGLADGHRISGERGVQANALREAMSVARQSRNGPSVAISAVRLAEVVDVIEAASLLVEAEGATDPSDLALLGRLSIARGRVALSSNDLDIASSEFDHAVDCFDERSYPSWMAAALLGCALAAHSHGHGDAHDYGQRAAVAFSASLDGPFLLDGFVFPELGSLDAIAKACKRLSAIAGITVSSKSLSGLDGVRAARSTLEDVIAAFS